MASETQKCACKDCKCNVSAEKAVTKDGAMFCCEECASGHAHHPGCEHDGCNCGG